MAGDGHVRDVRDRDQLPVGALLEVVGGDVKVADVVAHAPGLDRLGREHSVREAHHETASILEDAMDLGKDLKRLKNAFLLIITQNMILLSCCYTSSYYVKESNLTKKFPISNLVRYESENELDNVIQS